MTGLRRIGLVALLAGGSLVAAPGNVSAAPAVTGVLSAPAADCDDYYNPPWGYPPDYCNYEIWDQPVYADGVWFNGPIYMRATGGERWFWIRGKWRRHSWKGPLPAFRWGRQGFVNWHGKSARGKYQWRFGSRHNWRGRSPDRHGDRGRRRTR
jgi:hypothetical protein